MKLILLDNSIVKLAINPSHYKVKPLEACRSKFEYEVGQFLKKKFSFYTILQDFIIPQTHMSLDFWVVGKCCVEADGIQHSQYSQFFHGSRAGFGKQKERDDLKSQFCALNSLQLIRVPYADGEELQKILEKTFNG